MLTVFISPFRAERRMVREMTPPGEFIEIYVETRLKSLNGGDVKGLYKKARAGQLQHFTGMTPLTNCRSSRKFRINTVQTSARKPRTNRRVYHALKWSG